MLAGRPILAKSPVTLAQRLAVLVHRRDRVTRDTANSSLIRLTFRVASAFLVLMMFVSLFCRLASQTQTAEHAAEVGSEPREEKMISHFC